MRDADVRKGLVSAVRTRLGSAAHVLVPEVDIRWSTPARADALLVADRITGFEIKSDVDSLARLPRQVQAYGDVVERAYLVVGEKYRDAAADIVPSWWGLWTASWSDSPTGAAQVLVREVRHSRLNPEVNPLAVTSFLTRANLVEALTAIGERGLSSRSVDDLRMLLVGRVGPRRALALARSAMLTREDWRARALATV